MNYLKLCLTSFQILFCSILMAQGIVTISTEDGEKFDVYTEEGEGISQNSQSKQTFQMVPGTHVLDIDFPNSPADNFKSRITSYDGFEVMYLIYRSSIDNRYVANYIGREQLAPSSNVETEKQKNNPYKDVVWEDSESDENIEGGEVDTIKTQKVEHEVKAPPKKTPVNTVSTSTQAHVPRPLPKKGVLPVKPATTTTQTSTKKNEYEELQAETQNQWTEQNKQEWVNKLTPLYVEIGLDEPSARELLKCTLDRLSKKYRYDEVFGNGGDYEKLKIESQTCADEIDAKRAQAKSGTLQSTRQTNWTKESKQEWIDAFTKVLIEEAGFNEATSTYITNCAIDKIAARMSYTQFTNLGSIGIYDEVIKTSQVCVQEMFSGDGSQETSGSSNYQTPQSTSNTCHYCRGSGICGTCSEPQRKTYFKNCEAPTVREEHRLGLVQCNDCYGRGVMVTNIQCDCPSGHGFCVEGDCYVNGCEDGWVECPSCKYYKPGVCKHCKGTGK